MPLLQLVKVGNDVYISANLKIMRHNNLDKIRLRQAWKDLRLPSEENVQEDASGPTI